MKVYGWTDYKSGKQHRAVCAAESAAEFRRITGLSVYYSDRWVTPTKNPQEVEVATAEPGVVFMRPFEDRAAPYERQEKS